MTIAWCIFLFILGACVGSFLNVLVWRVPRFGWGSLISPPSHCPKCEHPLAWYDNVPVLGWICLRGRCRYCHEPISIRYPIVEFICGALFVCYYAMFFILHTRGMTTLPEQWPIFVLYLAMLSALVAVSLIDAELFIIPPEIPWAMAIAGVIAHAIIDRPAAPLSVSTNWIGAAAAVGGGVGLLISIGLFLGGILKQSFPEGEPVLEIDEELYQQELAEAKRQNVAAPPRPRVYSRPEIRAELAKEMRFILIPMTLGLLSAVAAIYVKPVETWWQSTAAHPWIGGMLGAVLGALVGAGMVWITRILGTLAFGRVAMGLGDVHLMLGIGAVIGAGPVAAAFFLAPFAGLLIGLWNWITRSRRELPYGPYLSFATAVVVLIYPWLIWQLFHGTLAARLR